MKGPCRRFFPGIFLLLLVTAAPVFAGGRQEGGPPPQTEAAGGEIPAEEGEAPSPEDPASAPASQAEAGEAVPGEGEGEDEGAALPEGEEEDLAGVEEPELSAEDKILNMDIRTSTLLELAAWCRSLGISEGGTREELISRLRSHFNLVIAEGETADDRKIIIIESARTTEYFTLEVVDEEYARLRGDVKISLKDGEAVHQIKAWEVLYNRTRNLMTASGGVEYIKTEGDTIETFRGESITVNLDNWSSVFTDGVSERSLSDNQTTYRFAGTVISRSDEEVTILSKASLGNANNEEAYWSLHASKIWLLPGSDWAILNAVLKVGEIPVLYIPAFYFPADEIIFHPALGYRSREGNFVQTTTYILGRPKTNTSSESSITKILGNSADMEKIREGIFLRSTGKKSRDPNTTRFSVIVDYYANLGAYLGTELSLPQKGPVGAIDLSGGVGFTRDVIKLDSGSYTPFPRYDGTSDWNKSRFLSYDTPFRYRLNAKGSVAGKYGSLSLTLPFYSDPYVDRDFLKRSEEMDWINMLKEGANQKTEEAAETILSTYEWRLNGSLTPQIGFLSPYISSFSVSSFTSTVLFRSRESNKYKQAQNTYSPNRIFYFPDKFTLYSVSLSLAGTPLTLGGGGASAQAEAVKEEAPEDPLKKAGTLRPPWDPPRENPSAAGKAANIPGLTPPALGQRFDIPRIGGPRFTLDYRLAPTSASELQFDSAQGTAARPHWMELEDVDWGNISSILTTIRSDGSVGFNLAHTEGGAYTSTFRFSGTGAWQEYSYLNEAAQEFVSVPTGKTDPQPDPLKISEARRRAYNASFFTSSWEHNTTIKPLYRDPVWGNSSLQYTVKGLMAKTVFSGTGDDPQWDMEYGAWEKEKLDSHQAGANLSASVMDKVQNLTITMELPPRDATVEGNATFRTWLFETNARGKIFEPWDDELRKFEPVSLTETFRWNNYGSAQQQAIYDPELEEFTNLTSSLSWRGFTASLTALRSRTYSFVNPGGWVQSLDDETLNFRELRFAYTGTFRKEALWNKRLSFSLNLNSSLTFDLQRYTYSRFAFSIGFTLGINYFVDLNFSATSENAVIFRYFQDLPFFDTSGMNIPPGDQNNLFLDLVNSFRFDNDDLRRMSGFKLKSFKLTLTHHLGDWNAKLGLTLSPYLDQTGPIPSYKFNNEVSFIVQWIPISEIKSEVTYNKEVFTFK